MCDQALVSHPQSQQQPLLQGAEMGGSSDEELEMDFVDFKPAAPAGDGSSRAIASGSDEWGKLLHGPGKLRRPLTKAAEALFKIAHSRFWPLLVTVRLWPAGGAAPVDSVDAGGAVFEYCLQADSHGEEPADDAVAATARECVGPKPVVAAKAPCTAAGAELDRMLELSEVQSWADVYARPPQLVAPRIGARSFAPRGHAARDSFCAAFHRPGVTLSAKLRAAATELAVGAQGALAAGTAEAPDGGAATELRRLAARQQANYALARVAATATFGAASCFPVLTPPTAGAALAHAHAGQVSMREALPLLAEMARHEVVHKAVGQRRRQFLHYFSRLGMPDTALQAVERWAEARAALQEAVARHDAVRQDAVRLHDARSR
jgi:hypothetical protein